MEQKLLPQQSRVVDVVQTRPSKRQKIDIACNICKSRKSKCDGVRPVCGPCSARRKGRDAHLCNYRSNELDQSSSILSPSQQTYGETPVRAKTNRTSGSRNKKKTVDYETSKSPVREDRPIEHEDADGMGNVESPGTRRGFLGLSSGANFMRQIRSVAEGQNIPLERKLSRLAHLPRLSDRSSGTNRNYAQFALPPRRTADHLFEAYWDYSDPIFPFLDRAEIAQQYQELWTGNERVDFNEQVFHCTMNLMFALASKLDVTSTVETRANTAEVYYERAKELLSFNLLDLGRLEILQSLLLTAQYLQSTKMPEQCFKAIRLATWVAQDLGLDNPDTTEFLESSYERQVGRRVWHGVILMDKIVAMTFGQPAMISRKIAERAVYPDADNANVSLAKRTNQPASLDFFISYCKLHQLLGDILDTFYSRNDSTSTSEASKAPVSRSSRNIGDLFNVEQKLSSWQEQLDFRLRVPTVYVDQSRTGYIERQANILHARYLYARLLLFRPYLTHIQPHQTTLNPAAPSTETTAFDFMVSKCQLLCVQAAQSLINHIVKILPADQERLPRNVLPSPWYIISYMYTASTVLIATYMIPSILDAVPYTQLNDFIQRAYQVLQHYETSTRSARRCRSALDLVHKKVMRRMDEAHNSLPTEETASRQVTDAHFAGIPFEYATEEFDNESLSSLPWDHNFSWLETTLFEWDSGSF